MKKTLRCRNVLIWAEHDLSLECWDYKSIQTPISHHLLLRKSMTASHAHHYFHIFVLQSHTTGLHFILWNVYVSPGSQHHWTQFAVSRQDTGLRQTTGSDVTVGKNTEMSA